MPTSSIRGRNHGRFEIAPRQRGGDRRQQAHSRAGQTDSDPAAEEGQAQALGRRLPEQAASSRAQDETHDDLPLSSRPLREQQVRDIGAGDQQHQARGRQEHDQRRAYRLGQAVLDAHQPEPGNDRGGAVRPRGGSPNRRAARGRRAGAGTRRRWRRRYAAGPQPRQERVDFRRGNLPREAVFHAREHRDATASAGLGRRQDQWNPEPRLRVREREPGRHDADHRPVDALQRHAAADDVRVGAESSLPEAVTENHDRVGAFPLVAPIEGPSERRPHTEHANVSGDTSAPSSRTGSP